MTLTYENDLDIPKMYLSTKTKVSRSRLSKVRSTNRTDRRDRAHYCSRTRRFVCRYWDDDVGRLLNDPLHRVCVVDWSQQLIETHGSMPGCGPTTVCYPIHLATLSSSDVVGGCYLLIADSDNDRVKLLGARLDYICDVLRPADGLCGPYRLSVDSTQTLLAVGCVDGRVFVYRMRDLLPDSVSVGSQTHAQKDPAPLDVAVSLA